MAKQSRLEAEAIETRKEHLVKNDYQKLVNEYSETHPDALSDGDPLGKGTGNDMTYSLPDATKSKHQYTHNVDTTNGGGQYDIEGRNERGGRKRATVVNIYSSAAPYGEDSVDTTKNIEEGQYVIR